MLYNYIGFSLNLDISVIKCYHLICMYTEVNNGCTMEYRSRKLVANVCYCLLHTLVHGWVQCSACTPMATKGATPIYPVVLWIESY